MRNYKVHNKVLKINGLHIDAENGYYDNLQNGYHPNKMLENRLSEEDRIQELMNRSDTAVIYPEPVSDQEENTAPHDNNNG